MNKCPSCESNQITNHEKFLNTDKTEHSCRKCNASWLEDKDGNQSNMIKIRSA